jgi:hypothetical protein
VYNRNLRKCLRSCFIIHNPNDEHCLKSHFYSCKVNNSNDL